MQLESALSPSVSLTQTLNLVPTGTYPISTTSPIMVQNHGGHGDRAGGRRRAEPGQAAAGSGGRRVGAAGAAASHPAGAALIQRPALSSIVGVLSISHDLNNILNLHSTITTSKTAQHAPSST